MGIGWFSVFKHQRESVAKYNAYLTNAENFEKKEIYYDALSNYKAAFEMDNQNYQIIMKIADIHFKLGDYNSYLNDCKTASSINPHNPDPYLKEANYYISKSDYSRAIKILNKAIENCDDEQINVMKKDLSTKCIEKYVSFQDVGDWNFQLQYSYITYAVGEKWGLAFKDGRKIVKNQFDYMGAYDAQTGFIPCSNDGVYFYIDANGNKRLVGDHDYTYLGMFSEGLATAQLNGKYGYIDTKFNEYHFEYEYAGTFRNNIAAVKQSGKWALVNKEFKNITGFIYDDILMDKNGICSQYNVIVVRQGSEYRFVDRDGKIIGNGSFESANIAVSNNGYIAVKKNGKWGFADISSNMVIEPQYESAKSFSLGLAPVKENDKWYYIDVETKAVTEAEYDDAGVFSPDGSAPVKKGTSWNFLILCEYA